MKPLIHDYNFHNDEIWNIVEHEGKIIFQYFSFYFVFDGASVRAYKNATPLNLLKSGGKVYSQLIEKGFYEYSDEKFRKILDRNLYGDDDIVAMLDFAKENYLLITHHQGIFNFDRSNNSVRKWDNTIK